MLLGKICNYVLCHECNHRRSIYFNKVLSVAEKTLLKTIKEEVLYTCGMQLVNSGSLSETVIMREGLNCQSPTEIQSYSGNNKLYKWPQLNYLILMLLFAIHICIGEACS